MGIDSSQKTKAVERLTSLGGLSASVAGDLVDAAMQGAIDQAVELIVGSGPIPTSMVTTMADRLRFICERAGRLVSEREVEILFRIRSSSAKATLNTMLATYEEALRDKFIERMRGDAKVLPTGSEDEGLTWTLRFTESGTLQTAWGQLVRLGVSAECEQNTAKKTLVIPRMLTVAGREANILAELGISQPS